MSIALDNRVTECESKIAKLVQQMDELNKRLAHFETRHKPGPKPKNHQAPPPPL